jgi:hypothetical protein
MGPIRPIRINVQGDLDSVFRWGGRGEEYSIGGAAAGHEGEVADIEGSLC